MENQVNEAPATTATVAQPQTMAGELAQLKELTGGNPVVAIVLVAIVILGSGAGWKFWQNKSEQKHEQAMKELELKAELAKAESKAKAEALKAKAKAVKSKKGKK